MRKSYWLMMVVLSVGMSGTVQAGGDVAAGEAKSAECVSCHGRNGKSTNPRNPNLAGQKEYYLVKSLKAYRDGSRNDPRMSYSAKALSDDDIVNLAAFYSRVK